MPFVFTHGRNMYFLKKNLGYAQLTTFGGDSSVQIYCLGIIVENLNATSKNLSLLTLLISVQPRHTLAKLHSHQGFSPCLPLNCEVQLYSVMKFNPLKLGHLLLSQITLLTQYSIGFFLSFFFLVVLPH